MIPLRKKTPAKPEGKIGYERHNNNLKTMKV